MIKLLKFHLFYPKIGPDMFLTHWLLYLRPLRIWFQKRKLRAIGEGSEIRPFVTIDGTDSIQIGNNVVLQPGCILSAFPGDFENGIIIEDDVLFAHNVCVYSQTHNYIDAKISIKNQGYIVKKTVIKKGAWLGVNSVILPGVSIGKNSIVAAGAVVTKDVDDFTVVAGVPAKEIRKLLV